MYLPTRNVASSVKKATVADECSPKEKHIQAIIISTQTSSLTSIPPTLVKSLTSIPLAFTPPAKQLQTLADTASSLGNSIHSSSSSAGMSIKYHGLRAFKGLIVVHSILQEGPLDVVKWVKEELGFWMNSLVRDVEWSAGGERGYGKLVAIYAKYLTGSVKVLSKLDLNYNLNSQLLPQPSTVEDADQALETIAYIQTLQDSALELRNLLVSELKKTSYPSCRGAALNLLIRDRVNIEQAQNTVFKNLNFVDSESSDEQRSIITLYKQRYQQQSSELATSLAMCGGEICTENVLPEN